MSDGQLGHNAGPIVYEMLDTDCTGMVCRFLHGRACDSGPEVNRD